MTRYFLGFFVSLLLLSVPVMAQEDAEAALSEETSAPVTDIKDLNDGSPEARLELSQKMHEIWPIRQKIENALDAASSRIPEKDRLKFKGALRNSIDFDKLEQASIDAMADIFSEKELAKMIEFYGSKEGRSVSYKTGDYEKALQPLMMKMLDKALLNAKMGSQSFPKK